MAESKRSMDYYIAQTRRIAEHREAGAEKEIRKLYRSMLKDLQEFVSDTYVKYAEEDKLTFAMLQKAGYDARFLEEVEQRINVATPKAARELRKLVEDTYRLAYEGMVDGVAKSATTEDIAATFADAVAITPEQIKAAVQNPVSGLTLKDTLEKNRREIIYSIKQTIGVGLMNGDRYTTMARQIAEQVDGDYKKAVRIARTEAHRVREAGNASAAETVDQAIQRGKSGMRMVKTWKTMKDERVRPQRRKKGKRGWSTTMGKGPNHMKLDGQTVLADELFDLGGGVTAKAPGQSGVAGHDINCRCYVSYQMMTDAEYFAKTGKHFPGLKSDGVIDSNSGDVPNEWAGRKTNNMRRDPANFRKNNSGAAATSNAALVDNLPAFKKSSTMQEAISRGKQLTESGEFTVEGIHLSTVNGFNESMFNVEQRFGRKLKISGLKQVKKTEAAYMNGAYDPHTRMVSLKGGNSANAMNTYKALREKHFASGWVSTNDIYGTFYHEIGHAVWEDLQIEAKTEIRQIYQTTKHSAYEKWIQMGGSSSGKSQAEVFGKELSRYAIQDEKEFFSEAFAQIMSGRMRPVSRQVNSVLNNMYRLNK